MTATPPPEDVDAYIALFPPDVQAVLQSVRAAVRKAAPDAVERISYRMPAVFQDGPVVYFGAFKRHIGLFPPVADEALQRRLAPYAGPKGNLQFSLDAPMPLDVIAEVVHARLRENASRAAGKRKPPGTQRQP
ncbi:MAG: hypothetical protein EOO21_05305 [Comamonadaceae bacterium]|nr:MAG: hypothetical protein EOO21_05305 [Comamonadaceae bacterium]